jgi:nucleoid-associated protein YgaU
MTRENKLAMVIGFGLLLFVGILVSDHLSARSNRPQGLVATALPAKPSLPGGRVDPAPRPLEFGELPEATTVAPDDGERRIALGAFTTAPAPREDASAPVAPSPSPTVVATRGQRHTVAEGDNPGKIARRYYGKAHYGELLAKHNGVDPRDLRIGQVIEIPAIEVLDPSAPAMPTPEATALAQAAPARDAASTDQRFRTVTVAKGDTLFAIAQRVYGDGTRWKEIERLNGVDAGEIRPGMRLRYAVAQ